MNTATNTMPAETMLDAQETNGFAVFDLPHALGATLAHMKYTTPTPVQMQAIPAALKGKDVLGSAQTGTGKTGAFLIPVIAKMMKDPHSSCLVMTPTRELASQILVVARQMLHTNTTIKTALLIGGESMGRQRAQIAGRPRLVIGTPGRINDHLRSRSNIFATTSMLVLDEADRMLDMGFTPQINEVIKHITTPNRQTLMFSATFPKEIIAFTKTYMNDPIRVTIEPERTSAANIIHETREVNEKTRYEDLMDELYNRKGSIIVFVKTKHGSDRLTKRLKDDGHQVDVIHGGLTQAKRDRAIQGFRNKKTRIMIATDVAARGLDVPHIEHVINYDLPQVAEDYVHRIGRTARNGAEGRALSFLMPSERGKWNAIQRLLNPGQKIERGGRSGGGRDYSNSNRPKRSFAPREDRSFEQRGDRPQRAERSEQPQGDFRQQRDESFKPRSNDGFKPRSNDGFKPRSEGGFKPRGNSDGFKPRSEGGFKPRGNDGFKPRNNDGFKPRSEGNFQPRVDEVMVEGNEPNFNRDGAHERTHNDRKPFQKNKRPFQPRGQGGQAHGHSQGGYKKPFGGQPNGGQGNFKPKREFGSSEPNFNTDGAGGEARFEDRPVREHDRKPHGSFQGKKKFFSKKKSFGNKPAA